MIAAWSWAGKEVPGFIGKVSRRGRRALWAALGLNPFVYDACLQRAQKWPDIPVRPVEFYGQFGEDLIVLSLLEARSLVHGANLRTLRYLEIGGNHPFATSATFLLSKALGMTGVIVEANPRLIAALARGRPDDTIVHGAVHTGDDATVTLWIARNSEISSLDGKFVRTWAEGSLGEGERLEVSALRINQVVRDHFGGESPCFVSIDVEGLDLAILRDFDFATYRPWLVQAEPSESYIPGNTQAMIDHMSSVGYVPVAKTRANLIFRDDRG